MQPPNFPPPPPQDPYAPQPWPGGSQPGPYQAQPAPYQGPPRRPGSVIAAAVLLMILAVIPFLLALAAFVGASLFHKVNGRFTNTQFSGLPDAVARVVLVIGVISLVYAVVKLAAGIGVLSGRSGWRVTGIVFAALGAAFWALALIGAIGGDNNDAQTTHKASAGGIVFSLVFLVLNVTVIVLLGKSGEWFRARRLGTGYPTGSATDYPSGQPLPPPGQYPG
jgi:hypothetical protein